MKIVQINTVYKYGSTGRLAYNLQQYLKEHGQECIALYGRGVASSDEMSFKTAGDFGVRMHALRSRFTDKQGLYSKFSTKRLIRKIQDYCPDLIHLHNLHGYYLNYKLLFDFLAEYRKPIVWTLHDCWAFTGHCSHFDLIGCERWKTGCEKCPQKKEYPKSIFLDHSAANYNLKKEFFSKPETISIVTPSDWLKTKVSESFLNRYPVTVIHNGIDRRIFQFQDGAFKEKQHIETKKMILGVANVWDERKGFGDFLKLSRLIDDDAVIVLVGITQKQKKSLPRNIIGILKTQSMRELAEIYSAADVFFNPTYEDNYPTVNLEALSCGTPVVTYDTGGSVEVIKNNGAIVNKGDLEGAREALLTWSEKKIACENFDQEICFDAYMRLYEGLV